LPLLSEKSWTSWVHTMGRKRNRAPATDVLDVEQGVSVRPVPPGLPCVAPVVAEEGTALLVVGLTWGLTWGVSRLEGGKP
jgi:hypothetical protein